jgi:hypothetical protein
MPLDTKRVKVIQTDDGSCDMSKPDDGENESRILTGAILVSQILIEKQQESFIGIILKHERRSCQP